MKDLGIKRDENIMEGPATAKDMPKVTYRKIDLPLNLVEGKDVSKDMEITIKIKGKIVGWQDTEWSKCITLECREGEIEGHDKRKGEESTLLS
jgi:hypothetical protein